MDEAQERIMLFKEFLRLARDEAISEQNWWERLLVFLGILEQPFIDHIDLFEKTVELFGKFNQLDMEELKVFMTEQKQGVSRGVFS